MRLRCYMVRRKLAAASQGEALPKPTARHLAKCEGCAAEARAYAHLRTLLAGEREECRPPEWEALRSRLAHGREAPRPIPRLLVPVGGIALAAVVIGLAFAMWPQQESPDIQRPVQVAQDQPKRAPVVERKTPVVQPDQPKANVSPKRIIVPGKTRINILRRYKPWQLTAQAKQAHKSAQQEPVRSAEAATESHVAPQPPRDAAVTDVAAHNQEQNGGTKYLIDLVAMDDSDYAPL